MLGSLHRQAGIVDSIDRHSRAGAGAHTAIRLITMNGPVSDRVLVIPGLVLFDQDGAGLPIGCPAPFSFQGMPPIALPLVDARRGETELVHHRRTEKCLAPLGV